MSTRGLEDIADMLENHSDHVLAIIDKGGPGLVQDAMISLGMSGIIRGLDDLGYAVAAVAEQLDAGRR